MTTLEMLDLECNPIGELPRSLLAMINLNLLNMEGPEIKKEHKIVEALRLKGVIVWI